MSVIQARAIEHEGRSFVIPSAAVAINDDEERLALAIVTGNGFRYGGGRIAYSLEPGAVDLGLARSGRCPVLAEHQPYMSHLLGGVLAATVEAGELRALCRFARGGQADDVWRLLEQGFPLSVSAGGEIEHAEPAGDDTIRAVRWRLTEISVVVRGRDEHAHVRALEVHENAAEMLERMNVQDEHGLGRRLAVRKRLRLDAWQRWAANEGGAAVAGRLGVGLDEGVAALTEEVSAHIREIEEGLAA